MIEDMCSKGGSQKAWAVQTLHISKKDLAFGQVLKDNRCVLGISCMMSAFEYIGPHQVVSANNVSYSKGFGPCCISLTAGWWW